MSKTINLPNNLDPVSIEDLHNDISEEYFASVKTAISKAKVTIMSKRDTTFISTVLFSLHIRITKALPTAGTDGLNLLINPEFFMGLSVQERVGLLFHETFHVVFNHMFRGRDLDPKKYNQAGDYVINLIATDANFTLPAGGLLDNKYKGMTTKEVYDLLPDPDPNEGSGESNGTGYDIIYDDPNAEPNSSKQIELTNTLVRASQSSKLNGDSAGSIPGEIEVMIDELLNPKLPWQILLQNYFSSYAKNDFSWRKPNRRFLPKYYLPSAWSEKCGEIAVAVDTSCSVSDGEFSQFVSEIREIKEKLNPTKLHLISFDTCINNIQVFSEDEDFTPKFQGRGGTDIAEVWEWIKENNPVVALIFSDGYFSFPNEEVDSDVIWLVVNNEGYEIPFGKNIYLNTHE